MSEYQYYEFQSVDRPLSAKEMAVLRNFSTRAEITPTSFVNHYNWGDFRGDQDAWMRKYFDAFLYLANWGTHVVKLRLPSKVLPLKTARPYCAGDAAEAEEKAGHTILSWISDDESEDGWDGDEGEGQLASILPVRAELARGDLRALYLGWLGNVQTEELADDDEEPPVPAGLGELTEAQRSLAEFLRVDGHLVAAAAEASAPAPERVPEEPGLAQWITGLPPSDKDKAILTLARGGGAHLGNELLARFRLERGAATSPAVGPARTVAQLLSRAEELRSIAAKEAAEKAAAERALRANQAAEARKQHLDRLAGKEPQLWVKAEALIATRLPASYDEAVKVLQDLRDLAARSGSEGDFRRRLAALRDRHGKKPTLIKRIDGAGL